MKGTKTEVSPGAWRLRVYVGRRANGTPIQVARTVHCGVRAADKELAKMVTDASRGKLNASKTGERFSETVADYIARCELKGRSPTTLREYRRQAEKVIGPALGHIRTHALTARQLDKFYAGLKASGLGATSIRRVHALIGASLAYAVKQDCVDQNVALKASPPSAERGDVEPPTVEEFHKILKVADPPMFGTLLQLAAVSGLRRGELCALRWSDLDWDAAVLRVARSVYETPDGGWAEKDTKGHQAQPVALGPQSVDVLKRHRAAVDSLAKGLRLTVPVDAFMFSLSPQGSEPVRPDWVTRHAIRAGNAAGVRFHVHQLRHMVGTQGMGLADTVTVSNRLRHRDKSVTLNVYASAVDERARDLAVALEDVVLP